MVGIQQINGIVIGSAIAKVYFGISVNSIMTAAFISVYLALFINFVALASLSNKIDE